MYVPAEGILTIEEFLLTLNEQCLEYPVVTNNKKISYYNIPAAFDIEASSFYLDGEKYACMYCWQFGINNLVTMGRTWEEFERLLYMVRKILLLSTGLRLSVYIHNFGYEFQWIRKRFNWDKVFIIKQRKIAYSLTDGIEFRCSLLLAGGKSLANVGEDLVKYKCKKLVGNLDYQLIRTPLTPLTEKELRYCENDIRVLLCYIQEKIEQDGNITKIPMTNTGYVRNFCRKNCFVKWKKYHNLIEELTITPEEYSQLKRVYQGGFTHASAPYVNKILHRVGSHDFGSSYPACMVLEKFPMSRPEYISNPTPEQFTRLIRTKCCMFDVAFKWLMPKLFHEHPLSQSKCKDETLKNYVADNGRIVMAEFCETSVTEQDFFTYAEFYQWEEMYVTNLRAYDKQYLPKSFVMSILDLYGRKTMLKGKEGEEINYMISKNMINASYGMSVTDPLQKVVEYVDDIFRPEKPNPAEALERYNTNVKRFLYYPWGVWITAYARANLFSGILEFGDDYVYSDTDSIKSLNTENHRQYIEAYNSGIMRKIEAASQYHNIDINLFMPKTQKGVTKVIGVWEDEGVYESFKTLGAKRYMTSKTKTDKIEDNGMSVQLTRLNIESTIAGPNKVKAGAYFRSTLDPFNAFSDKAEIPAERSGRTLLTYIDNETEGDIVDYLGVPYHFHELSSIHMEPKEYNMSQSDAFIKYLEGIHNISE